jgi:thioredoxin 1
MVDGVEVTITESNFQSEVLDSTQPVLVDFGADWCGPCRRLEPVIAHLSLNYEGRLKVGKVDVDDNTTLARDYSVHGVPALILFQNGREVDRTVGYQSLGMLSDWVDERIGAASPALGAGG